MLIIPLSAAISLAAKYVFKKGNVYYYGRRVPEDLRQMHGGVRTIVVSLKTGDPVWAAKKAQALAKQHDSLWKSVRNGGDAAAGLTATEVESASLEVLQKYGLKRGDWNRRTKDEIDAAIDNFLWDEVEPYRSQGEDERDTEEPEAILPPVTLAALRALKGNKAYRLSDAKEIYLRLKVTGKDRAGGKAKRLIELAFELFQDSLGQEDRLLTKVRRADANNFVNYLIERGNATVTVKRRLASIRAAIRLAIREFEIQMNDPFEAVIIPGLGGDSEKREPFTTNELIKIGTECVTKDDDVRWLAAFVLDNGSRLAEVAGLKLNDIHVNAKIPFVAYEENEVRTLKTPTSIRQVPLIGYSLWAAKRVLEAAQPGQVYAFPRYVREDGVVATHASNTINKWIKKRLGIHKTVHSFRHSMRDRLREVGTPTDIQDAIGGWAKDNEGAKYGAGYSLAVKAKWMSKILLGSHPASLTNKPKLKSKKAATKRKRHV